MSEIIYDENLVNSALDILISTKADFTYLSTDLIDATSKIINSRGFSTHVGGFPKNEINAYLEETESILADTVSSIVDNQIQVLMYNNDTQGLNNLLQNISPDKLNLLNDSTKGNINYLADKLSVINTSYSANSGVNLTQLLAENQFALSDPQYEYNLIQRWLQTGVIDKNGRFLKVPILDQRQYTKVRYGKGTVSSSGCGITSACMVGSYITGKFYSPAQVATEVMKYNGLGNDQRMEKALEYMDVSYHVGTTKEIFNALNQGKMAICLINDSSHFVLITGLTEDGKFLVNDPNGYTYTREADKLANGYAMYSYADGNLHGELNISNGRAWIIDSKQAPASSNIFAGNSLTVTQTTGTQKPNYSVDNVTSSENKTENQITQNLSVTTGTQTSQKPASVILHKYNTSGNDTELPSTQPANNEPVVQLQSNYKLQETTTTVIKDTPQVSTSTTDVTNSEPVVQQQPTPKPPETTTPVIENTPQVSAPSTSQPAISSPVTEPQITPSPSETTVPATQPIVPNESAPIETEPTIIGSDNPPALDQQPTSDKPQEIITEPSKNENSSYQPNDVTTEPSTVTSNNYQKYIIPGILGTIGTGVIASKVIKDSADKKGR